MRTTRISRWFILRWNILFPVYTPLINSPSPATVLLMMVPLDASLLLRAPAREPFDCATTFWRDFANRLQNIKRLRLMIAAPPTDVQISLVRYFFNCAMVNSQQMYSDSWIIWSTQARTIYTNIKALSISLRVLWRFINTFCHIRVTLLIRMAQADKELDTNLYTSCEFTSVKFYSRTRS